MPAAAAKMTPPDSSLRGGGAIVLVREGQADRGTPRPAGGALAGDRRLSDGQLVTPLPVVWATT